MDIKKLGEMLPALAKKYKYAVLVILLGITLMMLPSKSKPNQTDTQNNTVPIQALDPAKELAGILTQIHGVGKVQVLLTVKAGECTIYQTDEDITNAETSSSIRKDTVIVTDSERNQKPLVVQVLPPQYLGAVIVCQGAENAAVRLAVVEAVCKVTGLGADKISVLKMK